MTISIRYYVTLECDNCQKKMQFESLQYGADALPADWVQAVPSGERMQREFCSTACIAEYTPPKMPWEEEEVLT